jgi:hypothetical protein
LRALPAGLFMKPSHVQGCCYFLRVRHQINVNEKLYEVVKI